MQYKILKSYTILVLESLVESYLKAGWTCQGGISIVQINEKVYDQQFFQAIIKP